jgi:catechol 2,3-dioxygenase-like lactoylglutathione lyase family enzyme
MPGENSERDCPNHGSNNVVMTIRRSLLVAVASSAAFTFNPARGADAPVARPRILGVAQVAFQVRDIERSRKFFGEFLGYAEPFSLTNPDGSLRAALFKIGDRQSVQLIPTSVPADDRLDHLSLETDDAEAMRLYLKSRGVAVPDQTLNGKVTARYFSVNDPDGHRVEFMQFLPESWTASDFGQHLPATRLSTHMSHVGILVRNFETALKFYCDILGCTETWRGSGNGQQLSWVNMRVPDGTDWVEFMLHEKPPPPSRLGTDHHFCLLVSDVAKAADLLGQRPLPAGAVLSTKILTGTDNKRQIHAYDPDGTRIEIMEPITVDGLPAPSSTAPPPH